MTSRAIVAASTDPRAERYQRAERALWDHYGLDPTERLLQLDSPRTRLRVLEVGSGKPVVFVHVADGAGHMPWFDEPKRVAAQVQRFLAVPATA